MLMTWVSSTYKFFDQNLLNSYLTYFLSVQENFRLSYVQNDLMRGSKACKDYSNVILQFSQGQL
jgi:hypothetical protein